MSPQVRLLHGVRRPHPRLLVGGSPPRVLRLSPAGATALDALLRGEPAQGSAVLRRRLQDAGMVAPEPGPAQSRDVTVVVPVRGSAAEVQTVLDGVPDGVPVVVVDDASDEPVRLRGVDVVRRPVNGGPAAARNTGAARAGTRLVAFVDGGVRLPAGWLDRLTGHLHEEVVAVAPRIRSGSAPGLAGVLEQDVSSLDLGPAPGDVRPGGPLGYVPSTVLVLRRDALEAAGGFDEGLRVGEDVDLVWRLAAGGTVRYDPEVVAVHTPRQSLGAALRRRYDYGTSAGPLDARHPGRVRHLVLSPWSAAPWLAGLVHPLAVPGVAAGLAAAAPRVHPELRPSDARRVAARGLLTALAAAGRFAVRPGLPVTVAVAAAAPRVRRLLPVLAAAYAVAVEPHVRAGLPRTAVVVLDDLAYTAGVWVGCVRSRRWRPLVPAWVRDRPQDADDRGPEPPGSG